MPTSEVHAEVLIRKVRGELYLNDIPLVMIQQGRNSFQSVPVSPYLVPGANTVEIVVEPGPTPSEAREGADLPEGFEPDPRSTVQARLVRYQEGEPMGPGGGGESLADLYWDPEEEATLPTTLSATVDLGTEFGPWKWQEAEVLTLDEKTRAQAVSVIEKVKAAYAKGKPRPIAKLARIKHKETDRAFPGFKGGATAMMFKAQIRMHSKRPDWQPEEVAAGDYALRLVAGGRMIEAIARDWGPIVRMKDEQFEYAFMIGRFKGTWQILR